MSLARWFTPDPHRWQGVRPVNILLLRLFFLLVVVFVGYDSATTLAGYHGSWHHVQTAAWSMWAGFAVVSAFGIFQPLRFLPLVVFDVVYKAIWLGLVAWPLWRSGTLAGHPAEEMTVAFLWGVLPLVAMPWGWAFRHYFRRSGASIAT